MSMQERSKRDERFIGSGRLVSVYALVGEVIKQPKLDSGAGTVSGSVTERTVHRFTPGMSRYGRACRPGESGRLSERSVRFFMLLYDESGFTLPYRYIEGVTRFLRLCSVDEYYWQ